jgi:N-acetylglucosamine kinase-like BadF-type ATPase
MPTIKLIADGGSTKTEWCLLNGRKKTVFITTGMSPYFLNGSQMIEIIEREVIPVLKKNKINQLFYYGTGCGNQDNLRMVRKVLQHCFQEAEIKIETDITGAARALCGNQKGVVCILGTGSSACYFNGKKIAKNSPGLGYILGDEGSGAYLGKKVIQYYLYDIFDTDLRTRFDARFVTSANEILNAVYKEPFANRYLAGFAVFLAENRGHYMIENIIEDGLNDFFNMHLLKFKEVGKFPVHFTGGIAFGFKDVLQQMMANHHLVPGNLLRNPLDGLIKYHS